MATLTLLAFCAQDPSAPPTKQEPERGNQEAVIRWDLLPVCSTPSTVDRLKMVVADNNPPEKVGCALLYLTLRTSGAEKEGYSTAAMNYANAHPNARCQNVRIGAWLRHHLEGVLEYRSENAKTPELKRKFEEERLKLLRELDSDFPGETDNMPPTPEGFPKCQEGERVRCFLEGAFCVPLNYTGK